MKRLPLRGCARRRVSERNRQRRLLARRLKLAAKRTDEGGVCQRYPLTGNIVSFPLIRPCGATFPPGGRLWENHSFGSRCAFSRAGRRAMYRTTAQTVESRELTSVTPLAILVTTETNSAGWPKMYRLRK